MRQHLKHEMSAAMVTPEHAADSGTRDPTAQLRWAADPPIPARWRLVGGGAAAVNFWSPRKSSANPVAGNWFRPGWRILAPATVHLWDSGTMSTRRYGGTGIECSRARTPCIVDHWILKWGDLNLGGQQFARMEEPTDHSGERSREQNNDEGATRLNRRAQIIWATPHREEDRYWGVDAAR